MNNCGHNPGCRECRNHLSIRKCISLLLLFCEYIRGIYNKNQHVSYSINPLCTMQLCTCGLFCSGPSYAPAWSLGRHQGLCPLAPASLEPDGTGWLKPAAHSLRIKRCRGEKRKQSYCWSALLPYDEIQSDFCPGLKRILRVIIIAELCQAVKPFKWWLRGGRYEGKRLLFLQHLSQLICQAAS